MSDINTAIIERLERVVDSLQENSVKMGQLLAVHNEKLSKQDEVDTILFEKIDRIHADINRETDAIKKGCERDIRLVDNRLRAIEKKMWTIAGSLTVISVLLSPIGQRVFGPMLTGGQESSIIRSVESERLG
tara:strand:- start:1873 stop:2268 length:396 start_codon:yes stop_codon:yes gene_type:complete